MYGINEACKSMFDKYHYLFFDFLDGEILGLGDEDYVDGFHGGDVVYAEIVRRLAMNSDLLSTYIDLRKIEDLLKQRPNNLNIDEIKNDGRQRG